MRLLKYIWKNTVLKCLNSKMAVFVILMLVTSRSYLNPLRQFSMAVSYPGAFFRLQCAVLPI